MFFRSLRGQALACAEGYKKEEIMGKEGKRNEAKEMECKAWPGARWLLSVRNIILIFSYSSLLAWWLLLLFNRIAWHQWWIRQDFALALETHYIHARKSSLNCEALYCFDYRTTQTQNTEMWTLFQNLVQNKYNCKLKLENLLDIHFKMEILNHILYC